VNQEAANIPIKKAFTPKSKLEAKSSDRSDLQRESLVDALDRALFPAVAGTPPRAARLKRLNECRQAIASSELTADALLSALSSRDSGIANGVDRQKAKDAISGWLEAQI
jgi:hypothetical protein